MKFAGYSSAKREVLIKMIEDHNLLDSFPIEKLTPKPERKAKAKPEPTPKKVKIKIKSKPKPEPEPEFDEESGYNIAKDYYTGTANMLKRYKEKLKLAIKEFDSINTNATKLQFLKVFNNGLEEILEVSIPTKAFPIEILKSIDGFKYEDENGVDHTLTSKEKQQLTKLSGVIDYFSILNEIHEMQENFKKDHNLEEFASKDFKPDKLMMMAQNIAERNEIKRTKREAREIKLKEKAKTQGSRMSELLEDIRLIFHDFDTYKKNKSMDVPELAKYKGDFNKLVDAYTALKSSAVGLVFTRKEGDAYNSYKSSIQKIIQIHSRIVAKSEKATPAKALPAKASPAKATPAKASPVKKDAIKEIIDEWDSPTLPTLLYQLDPKTYNDMQALIERLNKKGDPVWDTLLLSMTKKYNDDVLKHYGNNAHAVEVLFTGLKQLESSMGANDFISSFKDLSQSMPLKKGYMTDAHKELIHIYHLYKRQQAGQKLKTIGGQPGTGEEGFLKKNISKLKIF